jgi:hypothetical protein
LLDLFRRSNASFEKQLGNFYTVEFFVNISSFRDTVGKKLGGLAFVEVDDIIQAEKS